MDPVLHVLSALRARDSCWMKRHRKLDTSSLFAILVQKRGHRSSIADALHQVQLHDRANIDRGVEKRATPAAITRALAKMPTDTFKQVHEQFVQGAFMQDLLAPTAPRAPLCVSIDGCHLRIPPALAHLRQGCTPTHTPHLLLTCAVDTRTDVIITYDVSYQPDERAALLRLVRSGSIPRGSCIIADRGYYSQDLWREVNRQGMFAVLRVKQDASKPVRAAIAECKRVTCLAIAGVPSRIVTWSTRLDDSLDPQLPCTPLQQCTPRHMWMHDGTQPLQAWPAPDDWFLLTNTLLPPCAVVQLYITRWRIETVHKTLESTGMGLGKHRGTVATIAHTIAAACLEHVLLRAKELQATQATRRADTSQHKAWVAASSSEHHQQLVDDLMLHLPPVTPLKRHPRTNPTTHAHSQHMLGIHRLNQLLDELHRLRTNLEEHAAALAAIHQPP